MGRTLESIIEQNITDSLIHGISNGFLWIFFLWILTLVCVLYICTE